MSSLTCFRVGTNSFKGLNFWFCLVGCGFFFIDFVYLLWNRALKSLRRMCVCVSCWDLIEKEKSFLLPLTRKATGVGADFLGNESILSAFTF